MWVGETTVDAALHFTAAGKCKQVPTYLRTLRELISKTIRMDSERGTRSFDTSVSTCLV